MVLLLTYYVIHSEEGKDSKLYLIHFFKDLSIWREVELWESILIQCIYIEKKATIRMIMVTSSTSNRN